MTSTGSLVSWLHWLKVILTPAPSNIIRGIRRVRSLVVLRSIESGGYADLGVDTHATEREDGVRLWIH